MAEPAKEPTPAPAVPSHIVVLDDADGYRKGMVLPYTPELVKQLGDNFRPATPFDLGVSGVLTR